MAKSKTASSLPTNTTTPPADTVAQVKAPVASSHVLPPRSSTPEPEKTRYKMTGVAYSVQASNAEGFPCFRVCTLFIVNGEIVHIEKTQEYASFETLTKTETQTRASLLNLGSRYKHGEFQGLGNEYRDILVEKLKKNNPKLLELIKPALYLEDK